MQRFRKQYRNLSLTLKALKHLNSHQNQGMNYGQQDFNFDPFFTPERTCEEILCYIFSIEFLNRELYLRKRITAEGLIDINHVMIFNK